MKKIGILTYHDSDNFGSVLQAYALSHYINNNEGICEIIDYRKKEVEELYKIFKPIKSRYNLLNNIFCLPHYQKLKLRKQRFEVFRQQFLPISVQTFTEKSSLIDCDYDSYIVGSDQVWNTGIIDFDESYMLDFTNQKKYSYAASFGSVLGELGVLEQYKKYLEQFDYITVREYSGRQICSDILGVESEIVCDPVFLLSASEWECLEAKYMQRDVDDYVLCYFPGGCSKNMNYISKQIARKYKCKRLLLMPNWHDWDNTGEFGFDVGPREFIYLIRNAKVVCTNSFHGTAFSVIFNKHFCIDDSYRDERVSTLLDLCNVRKEDIEKYMIGDSNEGLDDLIFSSKQILSKIIEE